MPAFVSIIFPTFNESKNIIELIKRTKKAVTQKKEIIVVDDNSPDGTSELVAEKFANDPEVVLITRRKERGLRSAIQCGIDRAEGEIISWMDCDLSMLPKRLPDLITPVEQGKCAIAVGSRYVPGGTDNRIATGEPLLFFHTILSRIITELTSIVLYRNFKDWTSGFIAIKSSCIRSLRLRGEYGEYFIDMMYRLIRKGYSFKEIPYTCRPRKAGVSKTATNIRGFFSRGANYLWFILKLRLLY